MVKYYKYFLAMAMVHIVVSGVQAQVGIGTQQPNASAVLELQSTNKGFRGPGIALTGRFDQATIPAPEKGLIVFNTASAGSKPNDVYANRYYFWNGTEWVSMPGLLAIEELIVPQVFYSKSIVPQVNKFDNADTEILVMSFETVDLNTGNIITPSANNTFKVNKSGLYELSSYINYNPHGSSSTRALQNIIIQKGTSATGPWVAVAGARGNWGEGSASDFKTLIVPITAVQFNANEFIRVITSAPYVDGNSVQGTGEINVTTNTPIAKSIRIRLIDYSL